MTNLNLPPVDLKLSINNGKRMIFDILRKKSIQVTPEEWVRQHFVHFLINEKSYPRSLMAN